MPADATPARAPWDASLTALRALFLLAMHHGCHLSPDQVAAAQDDDLAGGVLRVLKQAGFEARLVRQAAWQDVAVLGSAFPVLAVMRDGNWLIVAGLLGAGEDAQLAVLDPAREQLGITLMPCAVFCAAWGGMLLLSRPAAAKAVEDRFGLAWFMPEIMRHRGILRDVTIAALASSLIGLTTPLLYHVIIDNGILLSVRIIWMSLRPSRIVCQQPVYCSLQRNVWVQLH